MSIPHVSGTINVGALLASNHMKILLSDKSELFIINVSTRFVFPSRASTRKTTIFMEGKEQRNYCVGPLIYAKMLKLK